MITAKKNSRQLETIIVLDYGSQYNQLIVRRLRECGVWSELLSPQTPWAEIMKQNPKGIILSGGPASVYNADAPQLPGKLLDSAIPVLGICYGMQLLTHALGGKVVQGTIREYGATHLEVLDTKSELLRGINGNSFCWMSHGDEVALPPQEFSVLAKSERVPIAAIGNVKRLWFGVQFHPEVTHTTFGTKLIKNFLKICGCKCSWTPLAFIEETVQNIKETVGEKHAIMALSGGVDSSVAAVLVNKAIGDQLTCIFVNNGLLREGEEDEVRSLCMEAGISLEVINAEDRFLSKLSGVIDPEEKRKRIGHEFIAVFEEEAEKIGGVDFLVQGTLYPDVVESRGVNRTGALIKTHHNVGGLPLEMQLSLIEPFRLLFKDEVREIGRGLNLPESVVGRQPFPGPGLAVRVAGEVTLERLAILRKADLIVRLECERSGVAESLWQYFAVLLPVRSVGVMGDERSYAYTVAIRAVTSEDGMTADWGRIPPDILGKISNRIVNEVSGVNRVVYDLTSKPPGTIEWE